MPDTNLGLGFFKGKKKKNQKKTHTTKTQPHIPDSRTRGSRCTNTVTRARTKGETEVDVC